MSTLIYQQDSIRLDADRITEEKHPVFGDMTVFHNVVIASEMVQPYKDGKALKHRDELEAYSWTVDGRWIIVGGHPEDAIISDRAQVGGRTVNPKYVKSLKDPKTGRPSRAGVTADVQVFNNKVSKQQLDDMKSGKKADVSIGFFYAKDEKAGTVEDGPFKGDSYDYVQRNMFHDHTAVGIDNGRCPSPYCGLGADQIADMVANDPFSGFTNWGDCTAKIQKENPDMPKSEVAGICGKLKAKHEKNNKGDTEMGKLIKELAKQLLDELEEIKGVKDSKEEKFPVWWKGVDWKEPEMATVFDHLSPDVKKTIVEAGDCPKCGEDADYKSFMAECMKKGGDVKTCAEEYKKNKTPSHNSADQTGGPTTTTPAGEPLCQEILMKEHPDWTPEQCAAECKKIEEVNAGDEWDREMNTTIEKDAQLTSSQRGALPDEDFAYIDPKCKKEGGKTPDSCRHMPIQNEAHVRAALAALEGARSGKVPPYADEAKPKVCAAAKKFKMESTVCGTTKKDGGDVKTEMTPEEAMMGNKVRATPEELAEAEGERKKKEEELKKLLPKTDTLDPMAVLARARKILG